MAFVNGDEWKNVRSTFSPIFTSGKLKIMMGLVSSVTDRLVEAIDLNAKNEDMFEMKDIMGKFSMDSVASCAFGMDAQSFTNPNSEFVNHGKNVFTRNKTDFLKFLTLMLPFGRRIISALGISMNKRKETEFFLEVVNETINLRKKTKQKRHDMVDLMLELLEDDTEVQESENEHNLDQFERDSKLRSNSKESNKLEEVYIVATAMIILVAGYDTTAQALTFLSYYLALNQDIQEKLQAEIDEAFENNNGDMPEYSVIQNLSYLDNVIHETLRMHPPVEVITRVCTKDYKLPGTEVLIKKGEMIMINIIGIHFDEAVYPYPHKFNPENFSKEAKSKRNP